MCGGFFFFLVCVASPSISSILGHTDGLFHLFNLRGLYVQSNKLERIPPLIGQLTDLQELYASNNDIAAITANITTLERLDCLWLDDNPRLPRKLQQNVSRNRARVQRLLLDIAEFYGPAMLNVKRAVWYWLCSCEFGEELPSLLPREVAYHIATFVWKTRGDDSWRF